MHRFFISILILILVGLASSSSWPTFYYYSSVDAQAQVLQSDGLLQAPFTASFQTIFLVHGYRGSYTTSSCIVALKKALFENTQSNNIILVDWSAGAGDDDTIYGADYPGAVINARVTGKAIAKFVIKNKIKPANVYCIGFSLGAHVCGFAGKALSGKMGRITGLDPAGPLFLKISKNRLLASDAVFVDVIHTSLIVGTKFASGDIDFYANFDNNLLTGQPGCSPTSLRCNHYAACWLFGNSTSSSCTFTSNLCTKIIKDDGNFKGCKTQSSTQTSPMGYYAKKKAKFGAYVATTNEAYCQV